MRLRYVLCVIVWLSGSTSIALGVLSLSNHSGRAAERGLTNTSANSYVKLRSVDIDAVRWTDGFWAERFEWCHKVAIPNMWRLLGDPEISHAFENFLVTAGVKQGTHRGPKWHDGASPDGSKAHSSIQLVHQTYGRAHQLPNVTAYNESCGMVGFVLWNWRMLAITAQVRFADLLELALCNSVLATISLDGKEFFYANPLRRVAPDRRGVCHSSCAGHANGNRIQAASAPRPPAKRVAWPAQLVAKPQAAGGSHGVGGKGSYSCRR